MAHAELTQAAEGEAMPPRPRSFAASLEASLGMLVEIPAALLVVAEIVILFAGVVARYGLHRPLIWSDELASILFLWLAMLGAAVAFRRDEHMRMTAIVANAKPAMRAYLDLVATCAALAFLLLIAWPAYEYAYEESFITTPALQIPNVWRAAALPTGICLMALFAFLRLARTGNIRVVLSAVLSVGLLIGIFWLAQPWLRPLGNLNLIIFFVGVAGFCVFGGVPIAFSFGLATFGYLALTTRTPVMVLVGRMDEGMSHLILLSVPLSVFLGLLIEMTGMARAMVAFLASLLGHIRGGLHYVLVGAMYLVSGISGAKAADMAAVAPVLFPEMKARGARPGGVVALPRRGSAPCQKGEHRRDRASFRHRPARHRPALCDPLRRGRGHRDHDRSLHHRHCLCVYRGISDLRPSDLSQLRLAPARPDADRDRLSVGRHSPDHRCRYRHGLGPDPVRLLAHAGSRHDRATRRLRILHRGIDCRVYDPRQRARGHSGDCTVRPAAVSDRADGRRPRGALCHD